MPDNSTQKPNPSTYKQVLENMRAIQRLLGDLGDISQYGDTLADTLKTINNKVTELAEQTQDLEEQTKDLEDLVVKPPATGDIANTDDGVKVIGVHVNTTNSEVNTTINSYIQGVTWEFKNAAVIGLAGKPGVVGPYVAVVTVKRDNVIDGEPTDIDTVDFQIAYGNAGLYMYRRPAVDDESWGEWSGLDLDEFRQQIVESETQPTDQIEGEYWAEPIN